MEVSRTGAADSAASPAEIRTWVEMAQAGDTAAFAPVIAAYRDRLFRFTLRITRNRHDAEDICQRTFIAAWKHLARFDNSRPFSNWLFGIAYKDAVKLVTRRKPTTDLPELMADDAGSPADHADREGTPMWDLARAELSPERHDMLWMHYGEELPLAEIARITGRSVVSVKVHLFRARGILRERWGKTGRTPAAFTEKNLPALP